MQRRYRLRSAADFEQLRRHGKRWYHPLIVLVVRPNNLPESRYGFSASKLLGKATARNRAKRLLREAVRRYMEAVAAGWDCLFIAREQVEGATQGQIDAAVLQLLKQSDILKLDQTSRPASLPEQHI